MRDHQKELLVLPSNIIIAIQNKDYIAVTTDHIYVGDIVLDRKDGLYGTCDMLMKQDTIAIRDSCIVEVGVPKTRVYKLIPFSQI